MPYIGANTPNIGTDTAADLTRDITVDILESFSRTTRYADLLRIDQLPEGVSAGAFIVEGKEDTTDVGITTYPAGTQVNVSNGTQDEIIVPLDRPQYESRRIDKWDSAVARYDVEGMNVRQLGTKLANAIDRKLSASVEASSLATGLVGNGDGTVIVNTALNGGLAAGTTPDAKGQALIESIYAAVATMEEDDVVGEIYVGMTPAEFQFLPQTLTIISSDYTNNNGGLDIGDVKMVGNATVFKSNNLPATAGLIAQVFTHEAAGMAKLWDVTTDINPQPEFLGARLINSYFSNCVKPLRPQCSISIKKV